MKIPKGWRRLKTGDRILNGDKFWWRDHWLYSGCAGKKIGSVFTRDFDGSILQYIRRVSILLVAALALASAGCDDDDSKPVHKHHPPFRRKWDFNGGAL